jgi:colanic acid biosynthesis glycosyl transferase WcaI
LRIRIFNTYEPVTSFYRDLLPVLAERGADIEVIISRAEYRPGRGELHATLTHSGITVTRLPVLFPGYQGRLRKILIMLSYLIAAAAYSLSRPRVDLNLFLSQPPLFSLWGYVLKAIRRQAYCCLVMDLYPDLALKDGLLGKAHRLAAFLKSISRFALKRADRVIVIGRCMAAHLREAGVRDERLRVITNWAHEREIFPIPRTANRMCQEFGIREKDFIVLYSGNIGVTHFFDDFVEAVRRLRDVEDLRFIVIGDGSRRQQLERAKHQLALDNLLLLPFQPAPRLAESLSLADVHFISLRPGFEGLVVPSKAYGAMAVGRPIVYQGSDCGEIARMIMEENIGAVVPVNDPDGLTGTILKYYEDRALGREQGERARELSLDRFSRENALAKYKSALLELALSL